MTTAASRRPASTAQPSRHRAARSRIKRAIDLAGAGAGLVIGGPVLIGAAVAVRASTGEPPLFRQTRVGLDGREFTILKLRTMRSGERAPQEITRVGRALRRWSLDELPQLFNVARGDMSLVGPRPLVVEEIASLPSDAAARHRTRPGLTGLWQVSDRPRLDTASMVGSDLRYLADWSLWADVRLLARTPGAVLAHARAQRRR